MNNFIEKFGNGTFRLKEEFAEENPFLNYFM